MGRVVSTIDSRLDPLVRALVDSPGSPDDPINVPALLCQLATVSPAVRSAADRRMLTRLCHKIAVARTVYQGYDATWHKAAAASPLSAASWALAAGVLLAHAEPEGATAEEESGFDLVCLNAALRAMDRVEDPQVGAILQDWAEHRVRAATRGWIDEDD